MRITLIRSITFFFFILANCNISLCNETLINFEELNPTEARNEGKKIMVSFTAEWCLPCKMIKSSLYNDQEIADLVNENFQNVLVDLDSPLGELWHQSYNVEYLPTILFTNPTGIEFERIKKTPTKVEFLEAINRIISAEDVPFRTHNNPGAAPTIVEVVESSEPETKVEETDLIFVQQGRDIQLGAFFTIASAERRLNDLNALKEQNYMIIQEESKGRLYYKVVHTGLVSEEASSNMLGYYHQNGFEAFLRPK